MKTRIVFKGISLSRFNRSFQNDEDCYGYLAGIKWKGDSFVCKRCGNTHYCKGQLPFARRCTRCKYDESPTAGTLFDRMRIPLLTAFHIVFDMCIAKKDMSSSKQAVEYGVRQKTIWEFKRKMQLALQSQDANFLNGTVLVSDFHIMGQDKDQTGDAVLVAIEVLDNGEIGKAYGMMLDYLSPELIQGFFNQHISTNAKVYISKERDYEHLVINYNIEINGDTSLMTQSFTHISNLRSWLFGVHRHILPQYIQGYLNEYYFRFNRRNNKTLLFDEFISLMVRNQPNRT